MGTPRLLSAIGYTMHIKRLPILALVIVFSVTAVMANGDEQPKFSAEAEAAADQIRDRVIAELKDLGNHNWAGDYYAGNSYDMQRLSVAPSAGYVFESHGCVGFWDRNYGAVTAKDDRLHLSFTFDNTKQSFQGVPPDFIVIRWQARRYLVPADDVIGFCNQINEGAEPRKSVIGDYLLRVGDHKEIVHGPPDIPQQYKDYILTKPIEAQILRVGSTTIRHSIADFNFRDTRLTVGAGTQQGLLPGMELYVIVPKDVVERVKITKVEATQSEGVMTQVDENEAAPKAGWRLSTAAPWYPRLGR